MTEGLDVFVQLVIAAIITSPWPMRIVLAFNLDAFACVAGLFVLALQGLLESPVRLLQGQCDLAGVWVRQDLAQPLTNQALKCR